MVLLIKATTAHSATGHVYQNPVTVNMKGLIGVSLSEPHTSRVNGVMDN